MMTRDFSSSRLSCCLTVLAILLPEFVKCATRCYDNLGCYDSGVFHALPQDPHHVRTQFRISCRNFTNDAVIDATEDKTTVKMKIENSCFDVDRETKLVVHGFNDAASSEWMEKTRDLFLFKDDYNVVLIDWHHGANFPYVQAVANSFMVAKQLAILVRHLESVHGLSPLRIHLLGHSLGAQIAGNAGGDLSPSRVARVTGLDPAEPYFSELSDFQRLDHNDALFVDVIHTDGEKFTGFKGYGSLRAQGHVDFFPNGGVHQPGCVSPLTPGLLPELGTVEKLACSHARAIYLFQRSLTNVSCQLAGYACGSWAEFERGDCNNCTYGGCLPMGIDTYGTNGARGNFYLSTSHLMPFCGNTYRADVKLSPTQSHAYGRMYLVLEDGHGRVETVDFSRSNRHYHSGETEGHLITSTFDLPDIMKVKVIYEPGSGLSSVGTSDNLMIEKIIFTSFDGDQSSTLCEILDPVVNNFVSGSTGHRMTFTPGPCP